MIYYPGNLYNWPTIILLHNFKSDIILLDNMLYDIVCFPLYVTAKHTAKLYFYHVY